MYLFVANRNTSEPWWLQRTDFKSNEDAIQLADEHDDNSDHSGYDLEEENERRTARFTEYSMTSSVVPRSEGKNTIVAISIINFCLPNYIVH